MTLLRIDNDMTITTIVLKIHENIVDTDCEIKREKLIQNNDINRIEYFENKIRFKNRVYA